MSTTYKAGAIAHELADRLKVRPGLADLTITESMDSDQGPLITLSDGALTTTHESAIVKVEPQSWPLAKDVLGLDALQYTPHVVKLLWEASPQGGFTTADRLELVAQCVAMGCQVKVYESTSGAGVILADIDNAAKLVATYDPDAFRPLISSQ
jgi:hypothetical protein